MEKSALTAERIVERMARAIGCTESYGGRSVVCDLADNIHARTGNCGEYEAADEVLRVAAKRAFASFSRDLLELLCVDGRLSAAEAVDVLERAVGAIPAATITADAA